MPNVLDGLMPDQSQQTPAPDTQPQPEGTEGGTVENSDSAVTPLIQKYPFFVPLAQGQFPGIFFPKDFYAPSTKDINPKVLTDQLGLGLFHPTDPKAKLAIFNPRVISVPQLKALDQSGKLTQAFVPASKFIPNEGQPPAGGAMGADGQQSAKQDSNARVSPLPGPTNKRVAVQGKSSTPMGSLGKSPTDRPMPAAGAILNGLLH